MLHKTNKNKRPFSLFVLFLSIFLSLFFLKTTLAAPDNELTYHGKLTDTSNVAVTDGNYDFTLVIYDAPTGGNCLWSARGNCTTPTAKSLTLTNGIFSTTLGESGDNPLTLDFSENYYLGIKIGTNTEMTPRRKITPTGFALNANRLNGLTANNYINTSGDSQTKTGALSIDGNFAVNTDDLFVNTSTGRVGIGTNNPGSSLHLSGPLANDAAVRLTSTATGGNTWVMFSGTNTNNSVQDGSLGFWDSGSMSTRMLINPSGNVGIGTSTPNHRLHLYGTSSGGADIYSQTTSAFPIKHWFANAVYNWSIGQIGTSQAPNYQFRITDETAGLTRLGIDTLGRVGIGTTLADAQLHTVATTEQMRLGYNATNYLSTTVNATGTVTFNAVGTGQGFTFNDPMLISGNLTTAGHILPNTDNAYDLGSNTNRFRDLYLGPSSLHIGTNGNEGIISYDTTNNVFNFDKAAVFGNTLNAVTGTIRWSGVDFEGYDGIRWKSLTTGVVAGSQTKMLDVPVSLYASGSTAQGTDTGWNTIDISTHTGSDTAQFAIVTVDIVGQATDTITAYRKNTVNFRKTGNTTTQVTAEWRWGDNLTTGNLGGGTRAQYIIPLNEQEQFDYRWIVELNASNGTTVVLDGYITNEVGGSELAAIWDTDTDTGIQTEETSDDDTIRFDTAGIERLQLTSAGHLHPSTNNTYDLGSSANRFRDLYLGPNTLHIGSSATDEGLISYNTINNVFNFTTDTTTQGDIAFNTDDLYIDRSSGFVGIGTTTPTSELQIGNSLFLAYTTTGVLDDATSDAPYGRISADSFHTNGLGTGQMYIEGYAIDANSTIRLGTGIAGAQTTQDIVLGDNNELYVDTSTNSVGIGTSTPGSALDVIGNITVSGTISDPDTDYVTINDGLYVSQGTTYIEGLLEARGNINLRDSVTDYLYSSGGDVRINDSLRIDGSTTNYGHLYVGSSSASGSDLYLADRIIDWDNTGYYIDPDSISRINRIDANDLRADIFYDRNNTGYYLDPAGTSRLNYLNIDTAGSIPLRIKSSNDSGGGMYLDSGSGDNSAGFYLSHDVVRISKYNDNFGSYIGNKFQFDLDTDQAYKTTSGSWAAMSDERLKENITNITGQEALDQLTQLQGVRFDWINPELHGDYARDGGFIAQNVEKVFPQWVSEIRPESKDAALINDDVVKSFYLPFEFDALVVESIKQQNTLITENSNNLTTKATATSLSQLQTLVDTELTKIDSLITTNQQNILTLQEGANTQADLLVDIRKEIDLINEQQSALTSLVSAHSDTIIAINENILFTTDSDTDETTITISGITTVDTLRAQAIETNMLTINDRVTQEDDNGDDVSAASIGTAVIPAGENNIAIDTVAIREDARVFVSALSSTEYTYEETVGDKIIAITSNTVPFVDDVIEGKSFNIVIDHVLEDDLMVNWWIIKN
jgi:hypothetical protein